MWSFVDSGLLPFIFDTEWYNGMKDHQDGFTDDKSLYIVGMPRLRQLRAKSGSQISNGNQLNDFDNDCQVEYESKFCYNFSQCA